MNTYADLGERRTNDEKLYKLASRYVPRIPAANVAGWSYHSGRFHDYLNQTNTDGSMFYVELTQLPEEFRLWFAHHDSSGILLCSRSFHVHLEDLYALDILTPPHGEDVPAVAGSSDAPAPDSVPAVENVPQDVTPAGDDSHDSYVRINPEQAFFLSKLLLFTADKDDYAKDMARELLPMFNIADCGYSGGGLNA